MSNKHLFSRLKKSFISKGLLNGSALLNVFIILAVTFSGAVGVRAAGNQPPNPLIPVPMPAQAPAKEAIAQLPDTRLWYWDTGGNGIPVVLMHPASGSGLIWGYQQPAFAKAGYRVIGYSRRDYYKSDPAPKNNPGIASEDLQNLVEFLGIKKFHVVASAAGGSIAADYALSHGDRLLSMVISSNSAGARQGEIDEAARSIRPKIWDDIPVEIRELGPSYRGANPEGVKQWVDLSSRALTGERTAQKSANVITSQKLEDIKVPTLLITGDADMSTPPSVMRLVARRIRNSEMVIVTESGHSIYWEQPEVFNRTVLNFIGKHAK